MRNSPNSARPRPGNFRRSGKKTASRSLAGSIFLPAFLAFLTFPAMADSPQEWVQGELPELIELYRYLHAHPELSLHEKETAARLAEEWRKAGFEVHPGIGGHGVVGIMENGDGPTVMLRTDLDALPVEEQTGLVYASKVRVKDDAGNDVGVMHACGHDVHMTNITGVARFLSEHKNQWSGTVMLVGQPAEERGLGARAMLRDGLFEKFPKPDFAIALHVDSNMATGKVGVRAGYAMANVDSVDIIVRGKGGHGAYPHTTIDPIVQAAQLVLSLQTIVSREVKPQEPAVITVGAIHAGTKHNIIGDSCHLQLTVRSYTDEVREQLLSAIKRKAKAVAMGADAPEPSIDVSEGTPSLRNDDDLTARLAKVFESVVGKENIVSVEPTMGGEDFSEYGRQGVPILMYRLGAVDAKRLERFKQLGQAPPSLHSPLFYPDVEEALVTGVTTMSAAVLELLGEQ
ncbi:MAG: amidohydrolase [Planctomycetes bacterium]|nr:amidohydrolase [Planctomycetota bacterium]